MFVNDVVGNTNFAKIDWISPSSTTTATTIGTETYDNNSGFTNNGSTGAINTNYNPSTMGVTFTPTNNSLLVGYIFSGAGTVNAVYGSRLNSTTKSQITLLAYNGAWRYYYDNNDYPNFGTGELGTNSRLQVSFSNGDTVYQYRNGSLLATRINPPDGFGTTPNYNIYLCAINNNNTALYFGGNTYVNYFAAGGLIDAATFEMVIGDFFNTL